MRRNTVIQGDCLTVLKTKWEDSVFHAIVTDPPYGFSFVGKEWDRCVPGKEFWSEFLRVSRPGAHLVAFGGTRTFHRLACAIEDGGWIIRDCLMWLYGNGFPKSYNIGKKEKMFKGYGTALKPAWEPIILAMKPCEGSFVENARKWGVGGLNINGSRLPLNGEVPPGGSASLKTYSRKNVAYGYRPNDYYKDSVPEVRQTPKNGRWRERAGAWSEDLFRDS